MTTLITITAEQGKITNTDIPLVRVFVKGELDETNVEASAEQMYRVIDEAASEAVFFLDFSELSYMNSKSLGYLSDWYTKITERGGKIVIVGAQPTIDDVLRTVGLEAFIPMVTDYQSAYDVVLGNEQVVQESEEISAPSSAQKKDNIIQFPSSVSKKQQAA